MNFDATEQVNNAGKNTFAFIQTWGEISLMAMQKIAELQFTFASTQIDNIMKQLKVLETCLSSDHLLSAGPGLAAAFSARTVDVARKATTNLAASNNEQASQVNKRFRTATAPKIKPVKRKIRMK